MKENEKIKKVNNTKVAELNDEDLDNVAGGANLITEVTVDGDQGGIGLYNGGYGSKGIALNINKGFDNVNKGFDNVNKGFDTVNKGVDTIDKKGFHLSDKK